MIDIKSRGVNRAIRRSLKNGGLYNFSPKSFQRTKSEKESDKKLLPYYICIFIVEYILYLVGMPIWILIILFVIGMFLSSILLEKKEIEQYNSEENQLNLVNTNSYNYQSVPEDLKCNSDIFISYIKKSIYIEEENIPKNLLNNVEVIIELFKRNPKYFNYIPISVKNDKDLVKRMFDEIDYFSLGYMVGILDFDKEILMYAIKNNPFEYEYVKDELKKDEELIAFAVSQNQEVKKYINNEKDKIINEKLNNGFYSLYATTTKNTINAGVPDSIREISKLIYGFDNIRLWEIHNAIELYNDIKVGEVKYKIYKNGLD